MLDWRYIISQAEPAHCNLW